MKNQFKIQLASFLLLTIAMLQVGCDKPTQSPSQILFDKNFGTVSIQETADVKQTAGGGYLVLGTIDGSFSSTHTSYERDMLLIKTDADGNETWRQVFGEAASGNYTYDKTGVKIAVLPNSTGYVIAGNKTYKNNGSIEKTKIVLYELDMNGSIVLDPQVLRNIGTEASHSETIADIKFHVDSTMGIDSYILTGATTNLYQGKPGGIQTTDSTNILTMRLDDQFNSIWSQGVISYGFNGNDKGTSVQVLSDGYAIVAIDQTYSTTGGQKNIRIIKYQQSNGAIKNVSSFGGTDYHLDGGYSVIDEANQTITIIGDVLSHPNTSLNIGDIVLLQLDYNFTTTTVAPLDDITHSFRFFGATKGNVSNVGALTAKGIDLISGGNGFVLSATNNIAAGISSNIGIVKINALLNVEPDWPYIHNSTNIGATDQGGAVIAVSNTVGGSDYVFTGKMSSTLGLVKISEPVRIQ